jgi:hypothetical protein
MTNPTTPFSWQMPTTSDLVTDLPADFETFGQAVATSMADLLGGTSGQILSKASNTDMDFTWITNDVGDITAVTAGTGISGGGTSGAVTITNSMATEITAKGDLIAGTGSATFDNVPVGANNTILVADSTAATGLAWKTSATLYPWTTFTPTRNGITIGNGTESGRYQRIGNTIILTYQFTLGSTSAIGGDAGIQLPIFPIARANGVVTFIDAGTQTYQGTIDYNPGNGYAYFVIGNASGTYVTSSYTTATVPMTWTTNDAIRMTMIYEVA